jgi:3-hydroxyisobutyrate dehydrogenase-like beta-hydroxyacid dehydrogenase
MQIASVLPRETGPIGLLYPGEMGTAVGTLLCRAGCRLVTTVEGRGATTRRNCQTAGFEELDSLQAVVRTASMLLVLVPPGAALQVARQVREHLPRRSPEERLLYVDLNSFSPETACAVAEVFAGTCVEFVDGAILGLASRLEDRGVLYLSGAQAERVASLFEGKMQVQVLGNLPGQASTLRMLLSGLTKGVIALFTEMALAARQAGVLDRLLSNYQANYPGVMEMVNRILPTYPRHAARRGQEMAEVEDTLSHFGLCLTVVPGIRQLIAAMGESGLASAPDRKWSVPEVIEELHARRLLRQPPESDFCSVTGSEEDCAHGRKTTLS